MSMRMSRLYVNFAEPSTSGSTSTSAKDVCARGRIERREAHEAMNAALGRQAAIGVGALHLDRRAL